MSETFKTSDGCTIAYKLRPARTADSPRMVFIHSLALDAGIWSGVAARLGDHAQVLTYDCRGHGQSERRAGSYSTGLFARDLAELLDRVGWQTATVTGCSMGGTVAQAFAGLYPSRVSALGLVDTTAWYGEDAPKTWGERAATARAKGLATLIDFQVTRWLSDTFRAAHPEMVRALTEVFVANDVDCYAASCELLGNADLRPYLSSMRMPAAVVVGEEDYATPIASARHLHQSIQDSTLTIIPGARHLTPVECPDQIASELLTLVGRIRGIPRTPRTQCPA